MWVRRSAIRPVPRYARLPESSIRSMEAAFSAADARAQQLARASYERLTSRQPALTAYLTRKLSASLDDTALALGHMLALAVYVGFESFAGSALRSLTPEAVAAAELAFSADEELRRADPRDALDSDDIIAIDQPALVAFVNDHIERTLEQHAAVVDVDDVDVVYRTILVEILALSQAVAPPPGSAPLSEEPQA
ncbi:MAG TPA: hypothetical protein VFS67_21420 [Polyangiaceae bacterium]|jgi:hypothetical protein|nr:hypothetical protein [Polyangiaceae bacterium]